MTYLEYCRKHEPNLQPETYSAQQRLARFERDHEILPPPAKEPLSTLARLCSCVQHAFCHAVELVAMSRRPTAPPEQFVGAFVRLESFIQELDKPESETAKSLEKWPRTPGFVFGLTNGSSALEAAWNFAGSIYSGIIVGRALHRIPGYPDIYASQSAVDKCGQDIVGWSEQAMKEIREVTMPVDSIWPKAAHILTQARAVQDQIRDEYARGVSSSNVGKRRGRKPDPDIDPKHDQQIADTVKETRSRAETAKRFHISVDRVIAAQDRHRKRKK